MSRPIKPIKLATLIVLALACGMLLMLTLAGCTPQAAVKLAGGTMERNLPCGRKFVTITWEDNNLWVASRAMRLGEVPETTYVDESSQFGNFQGHIIVKECPAPMRAIQ